MADLIKGVMTQQGLKKIDYTALENKPTPDPNLLESGRFADAKAVGDELRNIKNTKADTSYVDGKIEEAKQDTEQIDQAISTLEQSINNTKADISYVNEKTRPLNATADDNGKILRVMDGVASWQSASSALDATSEDNGKVLTVVGGVSQWQSLAIPFTIDEQNNGKILTVVDGHTVWKDVSETLSTPSAVDGQFLRFRNGVAVWETIPNAEEAQF